MMLFLFIKYFQIAELMGQWTGTLEHGDEKVYDFRVLKCLHVQRMPFRSVQFFFWQPAAGVTNWHSLA